MRLQLAGDICGAPLVIYCISSLCTERFDCQNHAIPYALIRQIPVATIEIGHCRTFIYIPMMNSVARLSLIFSLTTTTNHFPFPHICIKNVNYGWYNNTCYYCNQHQTRVAVTRPYDMRISPAHLFVHFCVKSGILHCTLYTLQRMHSIPNFIH
jgi:hypothetical protein